MNEYDDLINQDKTESLRTSMFAASRTQPDQEADLLKLSQRTGLPVEAIRLKKPEVEMMDRINSFDYEKVIKESPKLSNWLADPKNAALASDDWENLSGIEKTFGRVRDLGGALAGGVVGDVVGRTLSGASTLLDVGARAIDRPIRQAFGDDVANLFWYDAPTIGGVSMDPLASLKSTGKNIKAVGDWLKPEKERQNLATDVAAGVGQIGGQIATFLLTGGFGSAAMMLAQGADGMSDKIEKDQAPQVNKDIAILTGGGITAVTEKIGLDKILNRVPPEIRNRTLRFIADKIAAGGIEAGQEFAEGLLQDIARKTLTNRDAELLGGIEQEVTAAGISAAIVRTALGVKGYNRAREQEQFVRALTDQSANSKLRERMPEKFKSYIDQLTANGPLENVFIPADQFTTYFQSQGLDPAKEASKLGVQNYAEASVAGSDVVIPTSEFVTQLSGTDALQGLWQDIRFQQGEMTLRESEQFRRDEADTEIDDETLARMTGAEAVSTTDFAAVKQQIYGELQGRFAADVADKYATQYAAVITTLAQRAGRNPLELAAEYDLRVDMPMLDALKAKIGKVDIDLDPLLDRLRAGDLPDMSEAFGPSLSDFIRKNGGLQVNEETQRLDESRAKGKGKIARTDGMSIDAALEAAIDAGYFDGRPLDELSEADLLDALAQDVSGSPVYSSQAQNQTLADQVRVLNDLQGFLDTIGADVTTMTNAEIRAKFREDAADGVAEVYDQGRVQTETAEFREWFGDSKVVDSDGNPMVVYHGTPATFDQFNIPAFFAENRTGAEWYADRDGIDPEDESSYRVMETFLSIKNPLDAITQEGAFEFIELARRAGVEIDFEMSGGGWTFQADAIREYSGYDGDNVNDLVYIPAVRDQLKKEGYDGIHASDTLLNGDITIWIALDPTQIKSATGNSGAFSGDNPNILFQSVEIDDRNLVALHNIDAANLVAASDLGGLPVPSIGATKAETAYSDFGEISLIGTPALVDPQNDNIAFGGDGYTVRFPSEAFVPAPKAEIKALVDELKPITSNLKTRNQTDPDYYIQDEPNADRLRNGLADNLGVLAEFVKQQGVEPAVVYKDVAGDNADLIVGLEQFIAKAGDRQELARDPEFQAAVLEQMIVRNMDKGMSREDAAALAGEVGGEKNFRIAQNRAFVLNAIKEAQGKGSEVDYYRSRDSMRAQVTEIGQDQFDAYVESFVTRAFPEKFIQNKKGKAIPLTLDNVVEQMVGTQRGKEKGLTFGAGQAKAAVIKEFKSLAELKGQRDRIVSPEQYKDQAENASKLMESYREKVVGFYRYPDEFMDGFDNSMKALAKLAKGKITAGNARSALVSNDFRDVSEPVIETMMQAAQALKDAPVKYFESKPQRAVDLTEFKGAVIPSDTPKAARDVLAENNIRVIEYPARDQQARQQAVADLSRQLDQETGGQILFQRTTDDKRGSIQIGANRKMKISLFEKANLSTFLHETGHFYLEVMGDLAAAPDAPQQIKDDYAAILKWMGVTSRAEIKTPQHEMFARANEAYLREGKSPSPELRGAFQRFRDWLISIYKSAQDLNVTLSDDLRAVFDRMYATDEQIEAARNEAEFTQMFASAADAGMTEAEFKAYSESVRQTVERGKEELQAKLMRQLQREKEAEWKLNREKMRGEVEAEVDAQPVYVAFNALKAGQTADEIPVKLSRENLVEVFGAPFLKSLPRGFQRIYSAEGGVDIDTAAEMFGFDSGRSMIDALVNMKPRDALIEQITDDRMRDLFGDIRFDGTIAEEAMQALHNTERENVLKIELRAIRKKAAEVRPFVQAERNRVREEQAAERRAQADGQQFVADALPSTERQGRTKAGKTFTYRAFDPEPMKRAAAGLIGQKQVRDIRPQGYLIAERNAARLGAKAMKEGDYMLAAEQKQRELFNHYLYKEATRVMDEVESKAKWLREQGSDAKRKSLAKAGADYLEQVDEILERYEFKRVPLNKLAKRESLIAWMEQQEAMGNAVAVPEEVVNEARRANWKQIPVDELRGVYDAVKNITHLARLKNKLIVRGKQRDFQEMKDELLDAIAASSLKPTDELMQINPSERTLRQKGAALWRGFDSAHIKIEQLVEWLDNGDINGPWARNFFDLADAAQTAEYDLHRKVTKALDDVRKAMPKGWQAGLFDKMDFDLPLITGTGTAAYSKPTRYTMLSIALNMGNEQNMQRLRDGNRLNDAQMQKIRDAMTANDWKFVQGVWDAIENLWPEMSALETRASGVPPVKVEPMAFEVDGVTYRGGYFPLVYDSRISAIGEKQIEGDKSVESFMASGFGRPSTNKGATKKRQDQVKQPLLLDMNEVIGGHIAKVVKDISHREAVSGLHKILSDQDIKTALIERLGEAYYREMRDWNKILVNDRSDSMLAAKGAAKIAMLARTNLTIVSMGWKVTTMLAQFSGFGSSADLVKPSYLGRALLQSTQSPQQTWDMISKKSGEMRNRVQTIDRDVRDSMRRIADKRSIVADIQRTAFFLTAYADRMVTVPTWLGAYNQAIAEGKGEEAAIRAGDRAVRLSQGGGGAKDLAAVQRNNELMKLMTMFYTPFSALYARLRDIGHQQSVQGIGYLPKSVARLAALVILPAVLGELLAGRGPDEDEDEVWWATRRILLYPVASLPGIRDFSGLLEQKMIALSGDGKMEYQPSYQISPVVNAIAKAYRNLVDRPIDVLTGEREFDDQIVQGMFESSGLLFGLPTAQVSITGGYLYRLMIGEEEPENIGEVMTGLMFRPEKQ